MDWFGWWTVLIGGDWRTARLSFMLYWWKRWANKEHVLRSSRFVSATYMQKTCNIETQGRPRDEVNLCSDLQ